MTAFADLLTIDHPAFNRNTVLLTEPIKELYQVVRHILLVRESGCCFTAQSGVGKTRALVLLEHLLRDRMPELIVIRHNSWNQQVSSIRAFFKHFLTAVGHPELRGETFDLRHRLVRRLIDLARVYQSPFVVLLIDEANAMRLEDFLFLKDIYNELDREGVQLVTIMMGQDPDFSDVIGSLRELGKSDLISRFARRRQSFRAFSYEEDVASIFAQYDSSVWPAETSQTWTQFFMPNAWDAGFRLENETTRFFEAVKKCSPHSVHKVGFPARQFFTALRRYLTVQHHRDAPGVFPSSDAWDEAVDFALLADSIAEMKGEAKRSPRETAMKIYDNAVRELPSNAALDLVPLPNESMVSSIWRFAWRNGLGVKELLTHCTHGAGYQKEHATFSYKRGFDPDVFSHSSWWIDEPSEKEVFGSSSEKHRSIWWNTAFRYCPLCLGHLYHSFWHQSKFLSHCPLDGAALRDTCYSCGKHLPTYGFHQEILSRPYVCPHCNGPVSGVGLSVDARLEIQQSKREYARAFESLDHWWEESTAARNQLESLLSSRAYHFSPWLRPETTLLQWVIHQVPPPAILPFTTRKVPQLVVLTWKIALERCDPMKSVLYPKRWKTEKLNLALKVYRATLRRLLRVIAESEPFDDEDYVRHRAESIRDLLDSPSGCNMKLLAFIMLRNSYETYFSLMHASPNQADFQDWNVGFPYGNEFAQRVRICWRAQFVAEYAAFYWWLVAVRDGRKRVGDFRRETATMSHVDVKFDGSNGDYIIGKVAFPAVDGLRLSLSP